MNVRGTGRPKLRAVSRRSLFTLLAISLAIPSAVEAAPGRQHTVMISIDGLRPEIYLDPVKEQVKVPNLLRLRDSGVFAERMIGVFPTVTYPSHTTLVTGVTPSRHGIPNNFRPGTRDWYLEAREIKARTLWDAYRDAGRKTSIVTWPASYGAKVDWLIPENLSFGIPDVPKRIADGSTPGLYAALEAAAGRFEIPSFDKADAGEKLDRMTAAYAAEIIRRHKPDLMLIHFLDVDHVEHAHGPDSAEARHAVELVDDNIGKVLAALRDAGIANQTNVVIVGDHGFAKVHTSINLAALLKEVQDGPPVVKPLIGGGSAGLYSVEGASAEQIADFNSKLQALIDRRYNGLLKFMTRAELERAGGFDGAAAGLTIPTAGYMLAERPEPQVLIKLTGTEGMHGYAPDMPEMATGFIAAGPAFRKNYRLPVMRMLDVAPTLALADGVPFESADGVAIPGILTAPPGPSGSLVDFLMGNRPTNEKR